MPLATSVEISISAPSGWAARRARSIASTGGEAKTVADGDDRFNLVINRGPRAYAGATRLGRRLLRRFAILFDFAEQSDHVCPGGHKVTVLFMPRRLLRQMVPNAVDIAGRVVPASNEALRLLAYCAERIARRRNLSHPAFSRSRVNFPGPGRSRLRHRSGQFRNRPPSRLRAARLDAVLRVIRADYADPEISPASVAARTGISIRYLHRCCMRPARASRSALRSFGWKRLCLLCRAGEHARKIIDVAYEAGFNDLPHFNRLFRRRYGLTPTAARTSR